jgi:E3 ubiquitin-protein ligase DOA10
MMEDENVCWICLDGEQPERQLVRPCKCPRSVHQDCLARWCLQSGGKE